MHHCPSLCAKLAWLRLHRLWKINCIQNDIYIQKWTALLWEHQMNIETHQWDGDESKSWTSAIKIGFLSLVCIWTSAVKNGFLSLVSASSATLSWTFSFLGGVSYFPLLRYIDNWPGNLSYGKSIISQVTWHWFPDHLRTLMSVQRWANSILSTE